MLDPVEVSSGLAPLDDILQRLRLGDNVVWQVDHFEDYARFAEPFAGQSTREGRRFVYLRFASDTPVLSPRPEICIKEIDPGAGFDVFCASVQHVIEQQGAETFYVFDNLSILSARWATDELLASFFRVTCPHLYELNTVAYFSLMRGRHAGRAIARIRDTTQVLINVYRAQNQVYVHPLKVRDRYSSEMFLPHVVSGERWTPIFHSGDAAALGVPAQRQAARARPVPTPWDDVYDRLIGYQETAEDLARAESEIASLTKQLRGMLIGEHPEFVRLAEHYLTLDDLLAIRQRVIGSGRIGGKATGMLLARAILRKAGEDLAGVLEDHDSFYIGSDVFYTFLAENDLFRLRLRLSREPEISTEEFQALEQRFLVGCFPAETLQQFESMLDHFGQAPIIVRSSSLMEDSFGNAFAGKYRSEFCAGQGTPDERLQNFLRAVKLVYASALNPDALTYRRKRGLAEADEQMAILVQRVAGTRYRGMFFPTVAGVAFSRNLHAWSSRIDPRQGAIRLVFGLGTRAVNRVGSDYPRMIAVSHPELRPEVGMSVVRYSQREMDVIDLQANEFRTHRVADVLSGCDYPDLGSLVSIIRDGYVSTPVAANFSAPAESLVLTFENLLTRTKFVSRLGAMLRELERAYKHPVDTEFTASIQGNGVRINIVQCRPMSVPGTMGAVEIPEDIPPDRILFRAARMINGGQVLRIRYIVFIEPARYAMLKDPALKRSLGRVVGRINRALAGESLIMMGPGRWGSSSIDLGVNVSYADINSTAVLVEIAREEAGHVPEVSYGTHFFQDLVEDQIIYLPVYPDDADAQFNGGFFREAPNSLGELLPEDASFGKWIQLIDIPAVTGGLWAEVLARPEIQKAICFLRPFSPNR
jgi:hypothetical protein